jgi:Protein of unknown function (DUF1071)
MSTFETLRKLNVNDKVEKKNNLSYLSWSWAWDQFKQAYPEATYEIVKDPNGLPYFESSAGAMCYTKVTAGGITHEMWLPVMDGANKAMKNLPYEYQTRSGTKTCAAFDMFDVNKTLMRCLVKNLAMFGLALYIYSGEDLPESDPVDVSPYVKEILSTKDLDSLKKVYIASVKACGELKVLEQAKDTRKAELLATQA